MLPRKAYRSAGPDATGASALRGGAIWDFAYGGDGHDLIEAWVGDDHIVEYGGNISFGGDGNDRIYPGFGANTAFGGAGDDVLDGSLPDGLKDRQGGIGDYRQSKLQWGGDTLHGGAGDDVVTGHAGNDRLIGGAGADALTSGETQYAHGSCIQW